MSLGWLSICPDGQTDGCIPPIQAVYLVLLVSAVIALLLIARRTRDLSNSTLALMPVAIAINIAVGALITALRIPIYLDSIGTVLVGALAGPWAGALTGLLSNLIWSILPVPGGAGPTIAFFAPVAAAIGLMAGFWAGRGVFQLRTGDPRVGGFLALALGVVAALVTFLITQAILGVNQADEQAQLGFVSLGVAAVLVGVVVAWLSRRTVFAFSDGDPRIQRALVIAAAVAAAVLAWAILRLLFGPTGWFSTLDGSDTSGITGLDLTALAIDDPVGLIGVTVVAILIGAGAWIWASHGDNARFFPVWVGGLTTGIVAAMISAPIAAGVFGGVTGAGTDALVALYRTLGLSVFQSAFAQGLTSDPLDKTISYTIVAVILTALPLSVRAMFSRGESTVVM